MEYKVDKLSILDSLLDFDVRQESEDICKLCGIEVPRELSFIGPVCIGDVYVDLCPRCAKGIGNLIHRKPPDAEFPSGAHNRKFNRFISWLAQEGIE